MRRRLKRKFKKNGYINKIIHLWRKNWNLNEFPEPIVVISKCIEFEFCRWNGMIIKSPFITLLKSYVGFRPVCAEVGIGLGVPRDPVRLIIENTELKMIQPSTGRNLTLKMINFSEEYFNSLGSVDGFILKSKSPSCGLFQTKHYSGTLKGSHVIKKGSGLFGGAVMKNFPNKAIETERRLTNFRIREHWLIKLYTITGFRQVKESHSMNELIKFHTKNKLLFMAYNQESMRVLGRIAANPQKKDFDHIIEKYEQKFLELIKNPPDYTSNINVLMHALGFFKKKLSQEEKAFFLDELEKYRVGWVPLFILLNLLKSWIARFDETYLKNQTFFNPYPEELMNFDLKDSWRGRSYWE